MKKIMNTMLFIFTIAFVDNIDARAVRRSTIRITPNEKAILNNTKALKNPSLTPEQKKQAEIQLANNLAKDKDAPLLIREQQLQEVIEAVTEEIKSMQEDRGYLGLLFDNEELGQAKDDLKAFKQELYDVQRKLKRAGIAQPKAVMSLKKWAVISLVTAIGLAAADQLITGGVGRTAVMGGISTAGSAIKSGASTAWSYVPSLTGSTPTTGEALSPILPIPTTGVSQETWGDIGTSIAKQATMTATASIAAGKLHEMYDKIMAYIKEAEENIETADPERLRRARSQAQKLKRDIKQLEDLEKKEQQTQK